MTTNVPQPLFGPTGFVAPEESEILNGVLTDINIAFGGGVNPALETPQGQLASSEAAVVGNVYDLFCNLTQQVDPAFADGRMQDAIARIYFLERNPAEATVVQATCSGASGVTIPVGSIAQAADGNLYYSTQTASIPISGSVVIPFACATTGPITCPIGTLNTVFRVIPGWDSIINLSDGVVGTDAETRSAFEARRAASVAQNSIGSLPSIVGSVLGVTGVLDAYVTENPTGGNVTTGGVSLLPHSLYVAAIGGNATDVATAIWTKKAPGCDYNGSTTVVVEDTNSGYDTPYPTYTVKFQIPNPLAILFEVNITNTPQVPSTAAVQIQNAIINAFNGVDGGPRARIGSKIYATRYLAPIIALGTWAQVISLQVGSNNTSGAVVTGSIASTTLLVTAVTSGALVVGQTISDVALQIAPGTRIVSFGTGAGGTGTYNLNIPQTISSRLITATSANQNTVSVNINQVPTIDASNIIVQVT